MAMLGIGDLNDNAKPTSQPPHPDWSISHLIDLEYLLHREGESADKIYFAENVEPWIEPSKIARPDRKTMSRALWQWLRHTEVRHDPNQLPGRAFSAALTGMAIALGLFFFFTGSGLIMGMMGYDKRTFNILLLLASTVGIQWVLLILAFLGYITLGMWRKNSFATLAQRTLYSILEKATRKALGPDATQWWNENARFRRLFALPVLQLTQTAGILFNLGAISALVGCVLFMSVRFGWETTPGPSMTQAVHQVTQVLAAPWAWAFPQWAPSLEDIEKSRTDGNAANLDPALARKWYPFFICALVVWGLFPRLLLSLFIRLRTRAVMNAHSFQERVHREWWRRMTETELEVKTSGPADGALVILWGGVKPDEKQLRVLALQQLRVSVKKHLAAGGADPADDESAAKEAGAYLRGDPGARVVVVAESWSLAPKDFQEFHHLLRKEIGTEPVIEVLLIGLPAGNTLLTPPVEDEVPVWQSFAGGLGDPAFFIRPCRGNAVAALG